MRRAWSLGVLLALLVPLSARAEEAAGPLPPDAVAVVGETVITRATFDRWLEVAARGQREVYDPPEFERCIARRARTRAYRHLDGDHVRLRRSCSRDYAPTLREVMQFLIEAEWVQGEAELQGIRARDEGVRRALERQKAQVFPSERAYRRWLRRSGMTEEMILFRVRLNLLQQSLTARAAQQIRPTRNPYLRARRQQRAIGRFVAEFNARWEAVTACAPGYVVRECGAG